jgi:ferritin-like protein
MIMETALITIQVDAGAAKAFAEASTEEQRKIQLLLSLRLQELTVSRRRSLKAIMDEIGLRAEARGLTPTILESLLRDE